jgi:hypothetical protein
VGPPREGARAATGFTVTRECLGVLLISLFDNLRALDNRKVQANRGTEPPMPLSAFPMTSGIVANTSLDALVLSRLLPVEGLLADRRDVH